jgi:hypothetical protein
VPIASIGGKPASIYAGSEIRPPPPATASTKPPRKTRGQTIRYSTILLGIRATKIDIFAKTNVAQHRIVTMARHVSIVI